MIEIRAHLPPDKGNAEDKMTLGLCMIVKDEQEVLEKCFESVAGVFDEIVIVDTGSKDHTREIAQKYADVTAAYRWKNDFSAARNYSFSLSSADYVMWLDADDILLPEDKTALLDLKKRLDGKTDVYMLLYRAGGKDNPSLLYYRERILKRSGGFFWQGAVHEAIVPHGVIEYSDIAVTHEKPAGRKATCRNLCILARSFADGKMPDERQKFYFARELSDNGLYETAASVFENFLLGNGWQEDKIHACRALALCYKCLGLPQKQLDSLFKSFEFAPPRSEICCDIGELFVQKKNWNQAIFWYKLALNEQSCDGFTYPDCRGFLPCIWLSVCYDRLGDPVKANAYNEQAGRYKPLDKSFLHNRQYFHSILHKKGDTL